MPRAVRRRAGLLVGARHAVRVRRVGDDRTAGDFLKCMDEERVGTALNAAGKCASKASLSITGITACYNDKAKSDALLKSAEADWNKAFQRATIPHVFERRRHPRLVHGDPRRALQRGKLGVGVQQVRGAERRLRRVPRAPAAADAPRDAEGRGRPMTAARASSPSPGRARLAARPSRRGARQSPARARVNMLCVRVPSLPTNKLATRRPAPPQLGVHRLLRVVRPAAVELLYSSPSSSSSVSTAGGGDFAPRPPPPPPPPRSELGVGPSSASRLLPRRR